MTSLGKPLSEILIVDLTRVLAGPFCTLVLADLGARVIKVERPDGGDDAREIGPFVEGQSAYFMSVNRGKESIALDLKAGSDRLVFEELLERADVLVENFRPGTLRKLGYDFAALSSQFPRLIVASISGFGQTGAYSSRPAYDMVVQAMGGIMSVTGHAGGAPTRVGISIGDLAAGLYAAIAIQAALLQRQRTGKGEHIDIAMLDCQLALLEGAFARFDATGQTPTPTGARHPSITPFDMFQAADGWFAIAAGNDALFRKLCALLVIPDAADDPRFITMAARGEHHAALKALIERQLAKRSCAYWCDMLMANGIPTGPYNTVRDLVDDPHVRARDMLLRLPVGVAGRSLTVPGNPIKLASASAPPEVRRAPTLDEHRSQILAELEFPEARAAAGEPT